MASKAFPTIALLLTLNLLFLSMANAHNQPKCRKDSLTLNLCANVLGDFLKLGVGNPHSPCCSLIKGLVDVELDACLCTVVQANILGLINVEAPIQLGLLLDFCDMNHRDYNCQ